MDRPDDGGTDRDADSDGDADTDGGAEGFRCDNGVADCPWEFPVCCMEEYGSHTVCTDSPDDYLDPTDDFADWVCIERLQASAVTPLDCIDGGYFHPEECPAGFPHCCSYLDHQEVCVDHLPVGWRCDD